MPDRLTADAWGTSDYLDRIEELLDAGDVTTVDVALTKALGKLGAFEDHWRKTRGWLGSRGTEVYGDGQDI